MFWISKLERVKPWLCDSKLICENLKSTNSNFFTIMIVNKLFIQCAFPYAFGQNIDNESINIIRSMIGQKIHVKV